MKGPPAEKIPALDERHLRAWSPDRVFRYAGGNRPTPHCWWRHGIRTLRPSSRLVVGRGGSAWPIGIVVPRGVDRLRFAAAAISDRVGRRGFTCVGLGSAGGF